MTTYYLSLNAGQTPSQANVAEATSAPTADFILTIGSGANPAANLSRGNLVAALNAFLAYVLGDDKRAGGAMVLPLTE